MSTTAPGPVRRAGPADAAAIAVVHARSWQGAYRGLLPQEYLDGLDPADRTERWRRSLERDDWPAAGTIVAVSDGPVGGFAHFGPTRDTDAGGSLVGEINAIYVLPEAWGTGLGRSLMTAALSELAAGGVASRAELDQLTEALRRGGVAADVHQDPLGPAIVTFRDPDNFQWEFFGQW
jgi:GNAT superfamily N-acetyltransferase